MEDLNKTTTYKLIICDYPSIFQNEINAHLSDGWELHGPTLTTKNSFYQAVIYRFDAGTTLKCDPVYLKDIDELQFTVRVANCLKAEGIYRLGDLVTKNERDLFILPNLGKKSLAEIKEFLSNKGLKLGMQIEGWCKK